MRTALLAACLTLLACDDTNATPSQAASSASTVTATASAATGASASVAGWPALPRDPVALKALIEARTLSPIGEQLPLTAARIVAGVRDGTQRFAVAAGWRNIASELSKRVEHWTVRGSDVYVLFGSFHDAPGQLDAFRHLVGPLGMSPAPLIALEQLHADGNWSGVDGNQQGDDALLRAYLDPTHGGDDTKLRELESRQRERNYTAWKYGYVERVTDVATSARAAGHRLIGCDMPSNLQARVRADLERKGDILRDLHCALALRRALTPIASPHRVALFIGDAHLLPHRLPRFVNAEDKVLRVHLVGMRAFDGGIEQELASKLRVTEPLLVPIAGARFVLLLPDGKLGAAVDRVRSNEASEPADRQHVVLEGFAGGGQASFGDRRAAIAGRTRIATSTGSVPFVIEQGELAIAGTIDMPTNGNVVISREPDGLLRIHTRSP